MPDNKDIKANSNFSKITIGLASPEQILEMSHGEVTKPETVNYRTYSPEKDGLFCERIFGPTKDYECHCGKYKRIRYRGIICDRCGVEVTEKKVRRERMGHIALTVPVAHIWYFHSTPNKIGNLLDISSKDLDKVIYYERYIVVQPGIINSLGINNPAPQSNGEWEQNDMVDEENYIAITDKLAKDHKDNASLPDDDPNKVIIGMGAEAIYKLLCKLDLDALSYELRNKAQNETSQQRKAEALKRLNVIEAFRESKDVNRPEWMILKVIPVIPPDLRPLVPLDGGRFATSDLNELYRRVIIRNKRLKTLIEIKAPEVILRNEKRMLQEAVDNLFDNSKKSNAVKSESNHVLKSLSDSLKGKQGRFRQNLLGKRVDYSARSVIVVGPELKMHECGMPVDMAAELYKPFIIRKLIERGIVKTVKSAKKIVDRKDPVVIDILENVIKGHPVLLNRAPTLHRLGIQAFQPKLIEGKAIQLHPLACTAFNADFDGDQMAIHLPLGNEAVLEAQLLMLGSHNILNPANGAPITVPSQDMVLGIYYITKISGVTETGKPKPGSDIWDDINNGSVSFDKSLVREDGKGLKPAYTFYGPEEAIIAYNEGRVDMHTLVDVRVRSVDEEGNTIHKIMHTSVGRVIFNQIVPEELPYINKLIKKKDLRDIIGVVMKRCGTPRTANFLDDMKDLGYKQCYLAGISFNLGDVIIPGEKKALVDRAYEQVDEIRSNFAMGVITDNERYNQVIDVWTDTNKDLKNDVQKQIQASNGGFNPIWMMLDSGARGSVEQVNQVCGMRGLMANPHQAGTADNREIIENPIISNIKEGLTVQEYFISTHGARKGLTDTALKTADAGYLTRRLVDVSHDVIINEEDCGTLRGIVATEIKNGDIVVETLSDRILGRVAVHDIVAPATGETILAAGNEITEEICDRIKKAGILSVEIRSVLTCESKKGVCAKCYGRNLATGHMVQKGEVVGVIAAQAIGEPGTQLTLRSFHSGGAASSKIVEREFTSMFDGILKLNDFTSYLTDENKYINTSNIAVAQIIDAKSGAILSQHDVPKGAEMLKNNGNEVKKGDIICKWDPYNKPLMADVQGTIVYDNLWKNKYLDKAKGIDIEPTFFDDTDETGHNEKVVLESKVKGNPPAIRIVNSDPLSYQCYPFCGNLGEIKQNHSMVKAGDDLASTKILSEFEGTVKIGDRHANEKNVAVTDLSIILDNRYLDSCYLIPANSEIKVAVNQRVDTGTPMTTGENPILSEVSGSVYKCEKAKGRQRILILLESGEKVINSSSYAAVKKEDTKLKIQVSVGDIITAGSSLAEGDVSVISPIDGIVTGIERVESSSKNDWKFTISPYQEYIVPEQRKALVNKGDSVSEGTALYRGAVISEVEGIISLGKIDNGIQDITVTPKSGSAKHYMIPVHHYSILFKEGNAIRKGMPITNGAIFPSISAEVDSIEKGKDGLTEIHLRKRYSIQDLYRILANDGEHLRAGAAIADQVVKSGIDGEVIISENEQYGLQITVSSDTMKTSPVPKGAVIMKPNSEGELKQDVKAGEIFVKIPRRMVRASDITSGLPRVTELFEARNPSNPAIVSEISGEVIFGKIKRGNQEVIVRPSLGKDKVYLVPQQRLNVLDNDYVKAGTPLSDGDITPSDILAIQGPVTVQQYIVNQIQDVYRAQGVKINDKHFEIIVRQMMRKEQILDPGDTRFLPEELVEKTEFNNVNDEIFDKQVVKEEGDSASLGEDRRMPAGMIVSIRDLREINAILLRKGLKEVVTRPANTATAEQILQGITRAALRTNSFMSAASFQETTKVLSEAAIHGKTDTLEGLKENVICGHLIPAGTGQREFDNILVASMDDYRKALEDSAADVDMAESRPAGTIK